MRRAAWRKRSESGKSTAPATPAARQERLVPRGERARPPAQQELAGRRETRREENRDREASAEKLMEEPARRTTRGAPGPAAVPRSSRGQKADVGRLCVEGDAVTDRPAPPQGVGLRASSAVGSGSGPRVAGTSPAERDACTRARRAAFAETRRIGSPGGNRLLDRLDLPPNRRPEGCSVLRRRRRRARPARCRCHRPRARRRTRARPRDERHRSDRIGSPGLRGARTTIIRAVPGAEAGLRRTKLVRADRDPGAGE